MKIQTYHTNDLFSLVIHPGEINTKIIMELFASFVSTKHMPDTYSLLKKHLPSILHSKCFNDKKYPFAKEVKKTEIGHLFEHILLEYLCHLKSAQGIKDPVHSGLTKWDWDHDKIGVFHILVDAGSKDLKIFQAALDRSIRLLLNIFQTTVPKSLAYSTLQLK